MTSDNIAILSNDRRYSRFTYGDLCIKFKTSPYLERYLDISRWNNGYIECLAKYTTLKEPIEEYIDLRYIAERLNLPQNIFQTVKGVRAA